MFNIGGMELIVIGLLALVVLGPERLPGAFRQAATLLGKVRQLTSEFPSDITSFLTGGDSEPDAAPATVDSAPADPQDG